MTALKRAKRPGVMSGPEEAYARFLDANGIAWWYEPLRLRLGLDWKTTYCPDFLVVDSLSEAWLVEVKPWNAKHRKPYWTEDSRVKVKAAAGQHPLFHFKAVWRDGLGVWHEEIFS